MANHKVLLLASVAGLFFILTASSSSFLQYAYDLKRRMLWVIPIAIPVALYKLEIVSQFVGKIIARSSKHSFSMPKGLHARQKFSSLSTPPAPWNLAILIALYLIMAICQDRVRTQFYM